MDAEQNAKLAEYLAEMRIKRDERYWATHKNMDASLFMLENIPDD